MMSYVSRCFAQLHVIHQKERTFKWKDTQRTGSDYIFLKDKPRFLSIVTFTSIPIRPVPHGSPGPTLEVNPGKIFCQEEEDVKIHSPSVTALNQPYNGHTCYSHIDCLYFLCRNWMTTKRVPIESEHMIWFFPNKGEHRKSLTHRDGPNVALSSSRLEPLAFSVHSVLIICHQSVWFLIPCAKRILKSCFE